MRKIVIFISLIFLQIASSYATNITDNNQNIDQNEDIEVGIWNNLDEEISPFLKDYSRLNVVYQVDLSRLQSELESNYQGEEFRFEWKLNDDKPIVGSNFTKRFTKKGFQELSLDIYEIFEVEKIVEDDSRDDIDDTYDQSRDIGEINSNTDDEDEIIDSEIDLDRDDIVDDDISSIDETIDLDEINVDEVDDTDTKEINEIVEEVRVEKIKREKIEKKIYSKTIKVLVYDRSFLLFYPDSIQDTNIDVYLSQANKDGIYIYDIKLDKKNLQVSNLNNTLNEYKNSIGFRSDYILVWGSRDFLSDVLSNINKSIGLNLDNARYNIVGLTNYNLDVLSNYLRNFISNKSWIEKIILLSEDSKYMVLDFLQINELIPELDNNVQTYRDVSLNEEEVSNWFFISKLINNLSNAGFGVNDIYILLIIPIILSMTVIFKHIIGFSPIGTIIPLFLTLIFFKLGIGLSLFLLILFVFINLLLSLIIDRYNLLYSPKITFLIIINILCLILILNILYSYDLININLSDTLYLVIMILIFERIINIITSKNILEYKDSFFNTIVISLITFGLLNIDIIKVSILSYPEFLILLMPLNFMIGRFSGLRVTEYFRFKEVFKNIGEQEE